MARRYGRAPRGERCRIAVPHGHYKTTTVTAALRTSGLAATALFDGATNGERFRDYITNVLAPVLKPGDIVILDNLGAHKVAGMRQAVATTAMAGRYGRSPRGERCRMAVPHERCKTTTLTAAVRASGLTVSAFVDGATNGERFRDYITNALATVL